jgi:hypothetical protein
VELGSVIGWDRYVGEMGAKVGMHTFGSSAPLKDLMVKFGFTPDKVLAAQRSRSRSSKHITRRIRKPLSDRKAGQGEKRCSVAWWAISFLDPRLRGHQCGVSDRDPVR